MAKRQDGRPQARSVPRGIRNRRNFHEFSSLWRYGVVADRNIDGRVDDRALDDSRVDSLTAEGVAYGDDVVMLTLLLLLLRVVVGLGLLVSGLTAPSAIGE